MPKDRPAEKISFLLTLVDQGYEKKAWHGPNLRGVLRGVSASEALWRPAKGRHNIWEIAIHTAYWKYIVQRRLLNGKGRSFPLKGSNWFPRVGNLKDTDWKHDLALLEHTHKSMREVIAALQLADLKKKQRGSGVNNLTMISGIAAHDLYHAGQIQLLKKMMK